MLLEQTFLNRESQNVTKRKTLTVPPIPLDFKETLERLLKAKPPAKPAKKRPKRKTAR
jgi:hypothetical protein